MRGGITKNMNKQMLQAGVVQDGNPRKAAAHVPDGMVKWAVVADMVKRNFSPAVARQNISPGQFVRPEAPHLGMCFDTAIPLFLIRPQDDLGLAGQEWQQLRGIVRDAAARRREWRKPMQPHAALAAHSAHRTLSSSREIVFSHEIPRSW